MAKHLLVDLENVQPLATTVANWMGLDGKAWIFYGPHQHKLLVSFRALGERVTLIPISRPGANSLDFHLVLYLGYLAALNPKSEFTVLAEDTGYDPAIAHAQMLKLAVKRIATLGSGAAKSGAQASEKAKSPRRLAVATKIPVAVKKGAAKKLPVAKKAAPAKKMPAAKASAPEKKVTKSAPSSATSLTQTTAPIKAISRNAAIVATPAVPSVSPPSAVHIAKPPAAKKLTVKPVIAIYRDVLADLRGRNRPRSLEALERRIQSRFGTSPAPDKVRAVMDHLKTIDAIRLVEGRVVYFPDIPIAVQANSDQG